MYLDKQQMFSEEQAVTVTAASTNVIDLGPDGLDVNLGGSVMEVLVQVREAFVAAGAATLVIALETDTTAAFPSAVVLAQTAAIPKASLTLDTEHFKIRVPHDCERFLRLNFTVATGPMTAGKIEAGLILDRQTNK